MITSHSLSCFKPSTKSLQTESQDIVVPVQDIDILKHKLVTKKQSVDSLHSKWFKEIEQLCRSTIPVLDQLISDNSVSSIRQQCWAYHISSIIVQKPNDSCLKSNMQDI